MIILTNKKGFTLIEVFLVVSMMGIVMITIFSTYAAGIRIWRAARHIGIIEERRLYLATEKMKKELSGYIRDFDEIEFEGNEKSLTFPYIFHSEIVKMTYEFDKGKRVLLRKVTKHSDSLKDEDKAEISELFEARDVEFSYLYYDEVEEEEDWVSNFSLEDEEEVPKAIKFEGKKDGKKFSKIIFIP